MGVSVPSRRVLGLFAVAILASGIAAADTIEMRQGPHFQLQRVFNNRHVENLFHDYSSVKFFLGRDNMREVLVIR